MGYIISGGSVNIDNNTIKKNAEGELYVNAVAPISGTSGVSALLDNYTTTTNSNGQIIVKPSTITQSGSLANITYSTNTTLTADVYANDITINNGITITTNGYNFYCQGTFTNNGTINTGTLNNGGPGCGNANGGGGAGGSLPNSYGGSGGGGGSTTTSNGTAEGGGNGGSTIAAGGSGGSPGGNGSTPAAPTLSATTIQNWYSSGIVNYLGGAGGGGGAAGGNFSDGGGSGSYGLYIQANQIIAGTINTNGISVTNSAPAAAGGGGGGGGGVLLLAYGNGGYTAGTYNVSGGSGQTGNGGANGGSGGAGQILLYDGTPIPLIGFKYTTNANSIKNRNSSYQYLIINTTSTTPTTAISQTLTPQTSGLIAVRVVARVYNNTIGDGVAVQLINGSTQLDSDSYTQEGLANNPHYIILYYEGVYPIGTPQTFSVQYNAITGGTAYCEIQEFTIEEVY